MQHGARQVHDLVDRRFAEKAVMADHQVTLDARLTRRVVARFKSHGDRVRVTNRAHVIIVDYHIDLR